MIKLDVKVPNSYIENYSSIFSEIKEIQLEAKPECLIGDIRSLSIIENDIYIINQVSSFSTLLRFNIDGKYLNEIGSYGNGPEEIINPRSIFIHNEVVEVWSRLNISQFTKDGKYLKKVFNAFYPGVGFFKKNEYYYLYHSAAPPAMLTQHKSNGEKIADYLPYHHLNAESGNDKVLIFNDQISFFSSVCDTIYALIDDKINPEAYFNFIGLNSPSIALKKYNNILDFVRNLKNYCIITTYFENSNFIIFEYVSDQVVRYCLYNKIYNRSTYFNNQIKNDLSNSLFSTPLYLTLDNILIIPQYPSGIHQNNSSPDSNNRSTTKLYDNPRLLFCKLKTGI